MSGYGLPKPLVLILSKPLASTIRLNKRVFYPGWLRSVGLRPHVSFSVRSQRRGSRAKRAALRAGWLRAAGSASRRQRNLRLRSLALFVPAKSAAAGPLTKKAVRRRLTLARGAYSRGCGAHRSAHHFGLCRSEQPCPLARAFSRHLTAAFFAGRGEAPLAAAQCTIIHSRPDGPGSP